MNLISFWRINVLDGGSDVPNGGIVVVEVVVKWNVLAILGPTHEWLGRALNLLLESDRGGGLKLLGGILSKEVKKGCGSSGELGGVEKTRALGARGDIITSWVKMVWLIVGGGIIGDDSFDEILMKSVLAIFIGGFWVEELALDAMRVMIKEET
ncbi:hypothetical protein Tco_0026855 [Tanacetum coccineum]